MNINPHELREIEYEIVCSEAISDLDINYLSIICTYKGERLYVHFPLFVDYEIRYTTPQMFDLQSNANVNTLMVYAMWNDKKGFREKLITGTIIKGYDENKMINILSIISDLRDNIKKMESTLEELKELNDIKIEI